MFKTNCVKTFFLLIRSDYKI